MQLYAALWKLFTKSSHCFRHGVIHNPFPEGHFGQSVAYVAVDGALVGLICFEDKIREDSHQVVDALSKHGISVYICYLGTKKVLL
jgi:hypothetical protein